MRCPRCSSRWRKDTHTFDDPVRSESGTNRGWAPCPAPCSPHPSRACTNCGWWCGRQSADMAAAAGPRRHDDRRSARAVLQTAFGWTGTHLHRFVVQGREYGIGYVGGPSFDADPRLVRLGDLGLRPTERFTYRYDFTVGWRLDLRVEQIRTDLAAQKRQHCPVCTDGRRAGPPEDCGGVQAFLETPSPITCWPRPSGRPRSWACSWTTRTSHGSASTATNSPVCSRSSAWTGSIGGR